MSRPIAESVSLLSETLTNCKTNLKDKGVESDTIKISDVDEKIAEIQAGGGTEIDISQFDEKELGIAVVYLYIFDSDITAIYLNEEEIRKSNYLTFSSTENGTNVIIVFWKNYPDPVTIRITTEFDGSSRNESYKIPKLELGKIICTKKQRI